MFSVREHEPACTRSQLELPPNSVLLGRCVWLVRAGRPKPRLVHRIFFSLSPNPGAFVIFTHRFWRGVGNHFRLWRTHGILAQELKFCGNAEFVSSYIPCNVERETDLGSLFHIGSKIFTDASTFDSS